jgi:phospho-N-acetylmuramoyl-pentapeptide-transferase
VLYDLLYSLREAVGWLSWLNVLRYTSTRILLGHLYGADPLAVLYPWFIRTLQKIQLGQVVRDDGPSRTSPSAAPRPWAAASSFSR